jgi:hypothetical protein
LQEQFMAKAQRFIATVVAGCIGFAGAVQTAQASELVSTEQVAASLGLRSAAEHRSHVLATLERADVSAALVERGVSLDQARARVAALTDAQAIQMSAQIDHAPAGASDVVGTDILGPTKIFPFTRSMR